MTSRQMTGGALLALATVGLLATSRRQTLPARWGGRAGAWIGGGVGSVLGRQLGRHPLRAARLLQRAILRH